MTALGMYVASDSVMMFSDAIAYDSEGHVRQIHSKQWVAPCYNTVMSASGTGGALAGIRIEMDLLSPDDFDGLMELLPRVCAEVHDSMQRNRTIEFPDPQFMVYVGGWSKRDNGNRGYFLTTIAGEHPAYEPQPVWISYKPEPDKASCEKHEITDPESAHKKIGTMGVAMRIMMAQRETPMQLHHDSDEVGFGVGGFVEMTTLTKDRATTQILWRWPDEFGKKVDPAASPAIWSEFVVQSEPAPLSRWQRLKKFLCRK